MEFFRSVSAQLLISPLEEQLEDIFVMSVPVLMKHLFPYSIFLLFSRIQNLKGVRSRAAGRAVRDYRTQKMFNSAMRPGNQGPNKPIKAGEGQTIHWGKPEKMILNFEV